MTRPFSTATPDKAIIAMPADMDRAISLSQRNNIPPVTQMAPRKDQ